MAAAVVKRTDFTLAVSRDDDWPIADHQRYIATCFRQLAFHTRHQPALAEYGGHIEVETVGFGIKSLGQSMPVVTLSEKRFDPLQIHAQTFL